MKGLLVLMFSLVTIGFVKGDLGSCVVYSAKFYLKDGTIFKGHFECMGDGVEASIGNEYCNDEGLLKLIKKVHRQAWYRGVTGGQMKKEDWNKFVVYKEYQTLSAQPLKTNRDYPEIFGFVNMEDIVFVDTAAIERVVFWDVQYTERAWLTSEIIVGNKQMEEVLAQQKYWNDITIDFDGGNDTLVIYENATEAMWGYRMINYSEKNNVAELKRLAKLKMRRMNDPQVSDKIAMRFGLNRFIEDPIERNYLQRLADEAIKRHQQSIKQWFWEKGILIIEINGTC